MSDSIADILERRAGGAEAPPPPHPEQDDAEAAAEALRRQVVDRTREAEDARRRADGEARRRADAEAELDRTRQQAEVSDQAAVTNALSAAKADADRLAGEVAAAGEAGDFRKIAELNVQLGRVGARMEQLESGAAAFEAKRTEALRQPPKPAREPTQDERIETDLAARTPTTATWLRAHREFYTDPRFNAKVVGAHHLALAKDLKPDTDDYFRFVEETIGVTQPSPRPPMRAEPTSAAPPSQSAPPMSGRASPGDLTISAEDRRVADWMGVDPESYAREKATLERTPGALYRNGKTR